MSSIIALSVITGVQLLLIFLPSTHISEYFGMIHPLVFMIIALYFFMFTPKRHRISSSFILVYVLGIVVLIGAFFLMGVFFGFGINPMIGSPSVLVGNIWSFYTVVILREYVRGKLTQNISNKRLAIVAISLVMSFSSMDNARALIGAPLPGVLGYCLDTLFPILTLNLFLTYVSSMGEIVGNVVFMAVFQGFFIFAPSLPNTPKILEAIIICAVVFVMYVTITSQERSEDSRYPWLSLGVTATIGVVMILFVFEVFHYFPLVVVSNSMKGVFSRGDVTIIRKIDKEVAKNSLEIGDIINYNFNKTPVVHRIVKIIETPEGRHYITKGDNNIVADEQPVKPEQIVGIARCRVPYIGYPTIVLTMR